MNPIKGGHVGKILRLDMTNHTTSIIPTSKYAQWFGGFGLGMAVWFDEIDKGYITDTHDKEGFEPQNVICLTAGPQQGTLAPAGARCEVTTLSPQSYPRPQLSRSNFGGKFAAIMKFAGYDGIVVKGASATPVWVNIADDKVTFENANDLWGLDSYDTQEEIFKKINPAGYADWRATGNGASTQTPAVVCISQAGENLSRIASLQHEEGHGAGCGGFGGVFGSKKLKAISISGTGSVPIADSAALWDARMWLRNHPTNQRPSPGSAYQPGWGADHFGRPLSCYGCDQGCYANFASGDELIGTGTMCVDTYIGSVEDKELNNGKITDYNPTAVTYMQRYGLNAFEVSSMAGKKLSVEALKVRGGTSWLRSLWDRGIIGPIGSGKKVETSLDFNNERTKEFVCELMRRIAMREEIGNDLAEGQVRCAKKWGILEDELMTGRMNTIFWAGETHWAIYPVWAYCSLFQMRDCNMHLHNAVNSGYNVAEGKAAVAPADRVAQLMKMVPAELADPKMCDQSETGVYSHGMACYVAFTQRYTKFYRDSVMQCDQNPVIKNMDNQIKAGKGLQPEFETRFLNAVTGVGITYEEGLQIGRKIWNFERSILSLHGRHRNEEYFPPFPPYDSYVYSGTGQPYLQTNSSGGTPKDFNTVYKEGVGWADERTEFKLDKAKMDEFKTLYYGLEGWDTKTGRPTRAGLDALGLGYVADVLASRGRLGGPAVATSVSIKASSTTARIGQVRTLSGKAAPSGTIGSNIVVYVMKPGSRRWTYSSNRTVYRSSAGPAWQYKYTFKRGMARGTYKFKAVVPGNASLKSSSSTVVSIKVS